MGPPARHISYRKQVRITYVGKFGIFVQTHAMEGVLASSGFNGLGMSKHLQKEPFDAGLKPEGAGLKLAKCFLALGAQRPIRIEHDGEVIVGKMFHLPSGILNDLVG